VHFGLGDSAALTQPNGEPVPGVSPAAVQMGTATANNILVDLKGKPREKFTYWDKGTMATIGRSKAIAHVFGLQLKGLIAWLFWLFLHVFFLIGFRNRFAVMFEWFWAYLTRERSARLITGDAHELRNALTFMVGEDAVVEAMRKREEEKKVG
jgi:NADH dehydrogenase